MYVEGFARTVEWVGMDGYTILETTIGMQAVILV